MNLGLIYGQITTKDSVLYGLIAYANNNFVEDLKDCKSMMGYYFFLNGAVILWNSKKQQTISMSITEAKYIALGHAAREKI